jgi:hypothetical protein
MRAREILNGAADVLESAGWCQHAYARTADGVPVASGHDEAVEFCAVGAMNRTIKDTSPDAGEYGVALDMLEIAIGGSYTITEWNDREGQTARNVISTLRRAAGWPS